MKEKPKRHHKDDEAVKCRCGEATDYATSQITGRWVMGFHGKRAWCCPECQEAWREAAKVGLGFR